MRVFNVDEIDGRAISLKKRPKLSLDCALMDSTFLFETWQSEVTEWLQVDFDSLVTTFPFTTGIHVTICCNLNYLIDVLYIERWLGQCKSWLSLKPNLHKQI